MRTSIVSRNSIPNTGRERIARMRTDRNITVIWFDYSMGSHPFLHFSPFENFEKSMVPLFFNVILVKTMVYMVTGSKNDNAR